MQDINRKELTIKTLLILISIWIAVNLIVQAIPDLKSMIRFINNIEYEILGGYTSDFFIQRNVTYAFAYNVIYILTLIAILMFSTISIFNRKKIKLMGIAIIAQNVLLLALELWKRFLIDTLNDIALIHIKKYLIIIVIITVGFIVISFKQKIFYLLLAIMTLLRCLNTINFCLEYIGSINNIYVILMCFCETIVLILYWIILLLSGIVFKVDKLEYDK